MFVTVTEEIDSQHKFKLQCIFVTMPRNGLLLYSSKIWADACWFWLVIGTLRKGEGTSEFWYQILYWKINSFDIFNNSNGKGSKFSVI